MEKEYLTKAICLYSCDYKEKDKQVTLFTLESGLMSAVLKGCRSPKAKLKFAFNPFCFAEYQIVQRGEYKTIINATLIDSFYDLTLNYNDFVLANIMLDIAKHNVKFDEQNTEIFILLLNSLKSICYEKKNSHMVVIKFCLNVLKNLGYKLSFKNCSKCGMPFNQDKYLDISCGELVCQNCKNLSCKKFTNVGFSSLKIVAETDLSRFDSVKLNEQALKQILDILLDDIEHIIERKLTSRKLISQI